MIVHYFFDHGLGALEVNIRSFNEHSSHVVVFHWLESHLNFGSALGLQVTDGLSILSNDEADNIIWHLNDVSLRRRRTIWSHHGVVDLLIVKSSLLVEVRDAIVLLIFTARVPLGIQRRLYRQLLFADLLSHGLVG